MILTQNCMCDFTQLGNSILFRIKQSTDFLVHNLEEGIPTQMVNKCSLKLLPENVLCGSVLSRVKNLNVNNTWSMPSRRL